MLTPFIQNYDISMMHKIIKSTKISTISNYLSRIKHKSVVKQAQFIQSYGTHNMMQNS